MMSEKEKFLIKSTALLGGIKTFNKGRMGDTIFTDEDKLDYLDSLIQLIGSISVSANDIRYEISSKMKKGRKRSKR